jgi:threonine dehydratase
MTHGAQVTLEDIQQAQQALRGITYVTPLQESGPLSDLLNARIFFKLENLQRTGSFKLRGAYNRMRAMARDELAHGVVTASAGNHAQGVALAAHLIGTSAVVVMPEQASMTKVVNTRSYGAEVVLHGDSFDAAYQKAVEIARETGRTMIPAFEDPMVVAGQGTVGLEMLEARPHLDLLVVPVGGGGLISGIAIAAKARNPRIRVIGVQAEGAASMLRARELGRPEALPAAHTIADGIAVKRPGDLTFALIQEYVDDLVTVADHDISRAILLFLEKSKLVVEGAGAAGLAALLAGRVPLRGERVGVVVSGGNIDVSLLSRILEKGLVEEGRQLHLVTTVRDQPGQLSGMLKVVAAERANVLTVDHQRWHPGLDPTAVEIRLVLETRDGDHARDVVQALRDAGYDVRVMT